jgi:hypothetical protein
VCPIASVSAGGLTADLSDDLAIVLPEVGYCLEVRHQAVGQPNQLDIALALPLQAPARLYPIEVSVDVNLQQRPRMIGRPPCHLRLNAAKAQLGKIKLIDKDIDCPNRIILGQIVFQPLGKQSALTPVIANDKARHRILRPNRGRIISLNHIIEGVFTQSGSFSEVATRIGEVCFAPINGLRQSGLSDPKSARNRHWRAMADDAATLLSQRASERPDWLEH